MEIRDQDGVIVIDAEGMDSSWSTIFWMLLGAAFFAFIAWSEWGSTYHHDHWIRTHGGHGPRRLSGWAMKIAGATMAGIIGFLAAHGLFWRLTGRSYHVEVGPTDVTLERRGLFGQRWTWQGTGEVGFSIDETRRKGKIRRQLLMRTAKRQWLLADLAGDEPPDLLKRLVLSHPSPPQRFAWSRVVMLLLVLLVLAALVLPDILAEIRDS